MRSELPICKRCCFCLPLRYGLLVWGYLKLAFSGLLTTGLTISFFHNGNDIVFLSISLLVAIADFVTTLILIIGCHTKNVKLLSTYYYYSIFLLVVIACMSVYGLGRSIYYMQTYFEGFSIKIILYMVVDSFAYFANFALQGYIILLVRSETFKLENGCNFRFVNNAAEEQCTIKVEEFQIEKQKNEVDSEE